MDTNGEVKNLLTQPRIEPRFTQFLTSGSSYRTSHARKHKRNMYENETTVTLTLGSNPVGGHGKVKYSSTTHSCPCHIRQQNYVSRDYNRKSGKCIKDCLTGQECRIAGLGQSVKNYL